jgi:hypothetical protein
MGAEAVDAMEERREGSLFVARVGRGSRAREGERIDLVVATDRLHFFDPQSGRGIYGADEQ